MGATHEAGTDLRVLQQRRGGHPASICPADFESLRSKLVSMGFDEAVTPGEIGGVDAWNFYRCDLVLTVIPGDLVFTSIRTECVRVIHTTDGMWPSARRPIFSRRIDEVTKAASPYPRPQQEARECLPQTICAAQH